MKRFTIATILALILAIPLIVMSLTLLDQPTTQISYKQETGYNKQLLDLVNEERQKAGLKALEYDITLESTAYHKTQDMVTYRYFAHERDNVEIYRDIIKIKPECKTAGENLGITNGRMQDIVIGWLNSETHRENMLNPEYDLTAVSVMKDYDQEHGLVLKATQHFCDL